MARQTNIDGMIVYIDNQHECPFFREATITKDECQYPGNTSYRCVSPYSKECPLPRIGDV